MIGRKTAALIAASIEAGALLATDDDDGHRPLPRASAGRSGSRSRSTTTCSGSGAPEQATGKEPTDIARHKKTLPVIYAFEHAGPEDRDAAAELYGRGRAERRRASPRSSAILERTGARDYTRDAGAPLSRRGAGRARRGRVVDAAGPGAASSEIIVSVISA